MSTTAIQMIFVDLALIIVLTRVAADLARRVGQPAVVSELVVGILLGPTLAGGAITRSLFPSDVRPLLTALADVGVALFMFGVGLELDRHVLRSGWARAGGVAVGSTLVPFGLGCGLALLLAAHHTVSSHGGFVVFLGLGFSITALPVLARILAQHGMSRTSLGVTALAAAGVVDLVAWISLAAVQIGTGGVGQHWRAVLLVPFVAVLWFVVAPLLRRLMLRPDRSVASGPAFGVLVAGALLSAAATEAMGLHFIFGAFIFGLAVPGDLQVREVVHERVGASVSLLLPLYFVVAGLNVDLAHLTSADLAELAGILVVAIVGKIGGTYLGARSQGMTHRAATTLGVLMNTRGLTELILLGVGLQLGLLDRSLYSLMVVMAIVTTAMTGPLLRRLAPSVTSGPRLPADTAR